MKQKITILILLVFSLAEIKPLLPFWEYYVNYEYISEVLCINKDNPISTCNGKCHLGKQIENVLPTDKEDQSTIPLEWDRNVVFVNNLDSKNLSKGESTTNLSETVYSFNFKEFYSSPPTPPPKS